MGETVLWLGAAFALAFVINLMPAFMPSTWMVLTFFYLRFGLPLLVLTIGGAVVSGLGRLVLARGSAAFRARFVESDKQSDLRELGAFLDEHRRYAGPATFAYVLTPLPSNNLFIAAGMVGVQLRWVLAGFWLGRVVADTFWVWTTARAFHSLGSVFRTTVGGPAAIALQVLSLASVLLLYKVPWARWLRRFVDGRR
ncbi:MAG TPA: hypothetical protein VEZ14_11470 [Dehalococcoidia bacterium]|nr:hypothetical protein [Dehalococcoidia bacterium]